MTTAKPEALMLAPGLMCDATAWRYQATQLGNMLPVKVIDYGLLDSLSDMAVMC